MPCTLLGWLLAAAVLIVSCVAAPASIPMPAMQVKYASGLAQVSFPSVGETQAPRPEDLLSIETVLTGARLFVLNITTSPMVFPIVNVRQAVVIRYLRADAASVSLFSEIARSTPIEFDAQQPTQGHIALTPRQGEMAVTWVSNATTDAQVRWGLSADSLDHSVAATWETYTIKEMCDAPASDPANFISPGNIYTAVLTGLPAGQQIFYQYGSPTGGYSATTTLHVVAPTTFPFNFTAFGDMGVAPDEPPATQSTQLMLNRIETTDLVLHIGDVAYANGYAYLWEAFFSQIEPVATRVPYMTSVGNHEYDYDGQPFQPSWGTYGSDSGGECGIPYMTRLQMPIVNPNAPFTDRILYYSFSYGPVHFVMMDSEVDFLSTSAQHAWLDQDLASIDRSVTPFIVVTNHRPMYDSSHKGKLQEVEELRQSVEPLLVKYSVDLFLVGHVHVYQRACRIVNSQCNDDGPVHMTIGNAGKDGTDKWQPQPDWVVWRSNDFGVTFFSVVNSTAMHVQFQSDANGKIEDDFWVYRK